MTAKFAHTPFECQEVVSMRIVNEVRDISRVAYDISGKASAKTAVLLLKEPVTAAAILMTRDNRIQ